jgi:hypothetical protein
MPGKILTAKTDTVLQWGMAKVRADIEKVGFYLSSNRKIPVHIKY